MVTVDFIRTLRIPKEPLFVHPLIPTQKMPGCGCFTEQPSCYRRVLWMPPWAVLQLHSEHLFMDTFPLLLDAVCSVFWMQQQTISEDLLCCWRCPPGLWVFVLPDERAVEATGRDYISGCIPFHSQFSSPSPFPGLCRGSYPVSFPLSNPFCPLRLPLTSFHCIPAL